MLYLQLGHPKIKLPQSLIVKTVKEIFLHLFHPDEESIFLYWHQIPIRFRYQQDLYHNFDSILAMVWYLKQKSQGSAKVNFMNQLVIMHWEMTWQEDDLLIKAKHTDTEDLFEPYAEALNDVQELKMSRNQFLKEWKPLIQQIVICVEKAQIKIEEGTEKRKWELVEQLSKEIEGFGFLYQKTTT